MPAWFFCQYSTDNTAEEWFAIISLKISNPHFCCWNYRRKVSDIRNNNIKEKCFNHIVIRWTSSVTLSISLPHFYACPKPGPGFLTSYVMVFSLCSVSSVKMRGDCSFYLYWWNWWPSLFSLHNILPVTYVFFSYYFLILVKNVLQLLGFHGFYY